jgi:hypothetical protein
MRSCLIGLKNILDQNYQIVVHIDQHHDLNQECPVLPAREGRLIFDYLAKIMPYLSEYAKRKLNEGNFTCPAFHYGIVGALYHLNPRENKIDAHGRVSGEKVINAPKTTAMPSFIAGKRENRIIWDKALTIVIIVSSLGPIPNIFKFISLSNS